METKTVHDLFTGNDVRFRIPIYQRHYVWETTHWQHLWNDIKEKTESILQHTGLVLPVRHSTGVIVTRKNGIGEIEVIDGQQRLTTFQIILCVIRDMCTEKFPDDLDTEDILNDVSKLIINRRNREQTDDPDRIYKLLPTKGPDQDAFQAIVDRRIKDSDGLLLDAYTHFVQEIRSFVEGDYKRIFVLSQTVLFYLEIVEQPLDDKQKAARVFESLNGRGLPLSQFDLLRNNVFLRAGNNKNDWYGKYWSHFNKESYWFSNDVVDDFLLNFLDAKVDSFNLKSSLFDSYQRIYLNDLRNALNIPMDNEDHPKLVKREFEELQQYSKSYYQISHCTAESPIWFYQILKNELKINSWHPLILLLKTELKLSADEEQKIFRILETYIVRNMLYYPEIQGWIRESYFRRLRQDIVKRIRGGNRSFEEIVRSILSILKRERNDYLLPDDKQIIEALQTAGHHWSRVLIRYILFKINQKNTDPRYSMTQLTWSPDKDRKTSLTIEHVMPYKWETATVKGSNVLLWPVREAQQSKAYHEKARERDRCAQSIGNLTLLTQPHNNEEVQVSSFLTKKEEYKKHSRIPLSDNIIHDKEGDENKVWDVQQIQDREGILVQEFYKIWPFPDASEEN